jgi:ABC-type uncharacterized transport system, permease component
MKRFVYYVKLAFYLLKVNIMSDFQYRAYLISYFISNPMQFIFGLITVHVVISRFQPLGGWSFGQVVFLYGLGIISHGLSIVFFIQGWYIEYGIAEGSFDRLIIRPINTFFQICFDNFNFIGFTDLIPGLIVFVYGCVVSGFQVTLVNILKILIIIIGATLLRGGLFYLTGSLSFWTRRSRSIIGIHLTMFDYTTRYPINIYPEALQGIFTFLIPYGFIAFYPASELLNLQTGLMLPGSLSLWTLLVGVCVFLLSVAVFNIGMKRYESAGS